MTEKEYRSLSNDKYFSYSFLTQFNEFGGKHLINPKKINNIGINFGSLIHKLVLDNDNFNKEYYISNIDKDLTNTEKILYDKLIDNYEINSKFINSNIFLNICVKYIKTLKLWNNIKNEELLKNKINNNFKNHLLEFNESLSKKIISQTDFLEATYIYNILKTNKFTSFFFKNHDPKSIEILFETPILYKIEIDNFKSLLDIIVINHDLKSVYMVDLKTGSSYNKGFKFDFFKRRYDIQAFLYTKALEEFILINNLKNYTITDPIYIYISRLTPDSPLLFKIKYDILKRAYSGFITSNNRIYKGVKDLVLEIKWHRKTNIYNYTKKEYENNGMIDISKFDMPSQLLSNFNNNIFNRYLNQRDLSRIIRDVI